MFYGCSSLLIHPDISKWNFNEINYEYLFFSGLSNLDITSSNSYSGNADSLIINSVSSIIFS